MEDEQVLTQRKPTEGETEGEAEPQPEPQPEPEAKEEKQPEPAAEAPAAEAPAAEGAPQESRVGKLLRGAADHMPEGVKNAMHKLAPVADAIHHGFVIAWPYMVTAYRNGKAVYDKMPQYSCVMIYGLIVAFCGAHFAALVAVAEAFKQTGAFKKIKACLDELYDSFQKLHVENQKDNTLDEDNDGILDVDELSNGELFLRKCTLVMRSVDPHKVNKALSGLYQGFLAAIMVVQFEFAKTVTLGASLGGFLERSIRIVLDPLLDMTIPEEYHSWIELLTTYICRAIGVSIAWAVQFYNSLLHCAIMGGLVFSRALVPFLNDREVIHVKVEETYLDEIVGFAVALLAIIAQAAVSFKLLFPFNVLLSPLLGVEWTLRLCASDETFGGANATF